MCQIGNKNVTPVNENKQMESYTWRQNKKSIPKFVKLKSKNILATNKIINMLILFA